MSKWEKVRLGPLTSVRTGKLDVNAGSINGAYPFFTCAKEPYKISSYSYDCECVLVAGNGDLNVKYYNGKFDAYQRTYIIESINQNELFTPYLFYFLSKYIDKLREQSIGGVIKYIRLANLTEANIPIPPIEVQRSIAKTLDIAAELLTMQKHRLAELDNLVKSIFYDIFGDPATNIKRWDMGKIRDVVKEVKYGTSKPATENGRYIYLRMNNITYDGQMDFNDIKYIDLPESEVEKYIVKSGDVLFNRTNSKELVGKTAVFSNDTPMIIAGYLIRLRVNERVNSEFLSAILNSKYGKNTLYNMCKAIVGQANINAQELQNIRIFIPPISLQNRYCDIVTKVEEQKSIAKKAIVESQYLFDSLMSEYFE